MERDTHKRPEHAKTSSKTSPVKTVISWLIETDREFRVAQSMVNDTHDRL